MPIENGRMSDGSEFEIFYRLVMANLPQYANEIVKILHENVQKNVEIEVFKIGKM